MGGEKAAALLGGATLLDRALAALRPVCARLAVVAKAETALPPLPPDVELWIEATEERHPRHGIVEAVRRTGRPVLVLAVDLPLVPRPLLEELAATVAAGAPAAVARAGGRSQPLCAAYAPEALAVLEAASPDEPLTRTVERLGPVAVETEERFLLNVNTPDDLARAAARLG